MKNTLVLLILIISTTISYGQSSSKTNAELVMKYIVECSCTKVDMISGQYTRDYSDAWLENLAIEDDFLVFQKGEVKHRWNIAHIIHVEQSTSKLEVYLGSWIRN